MVELSVGMIASSSQPHQSNRVSRGLMFCLYPLSIIRQTMAHTNSTSYRMVSETWMDSVLMGFSAHSPYFTMRSQVFEALLVLWAATLGDAFMSTPLSLRAQSHISSSSKAHLAMSTSSQSSSGTRRDLIQTASVAFAGMLGSAMLPAGALAAASEQRRGVSVHVLLWTGESAHHI